MVARGWRASASVPLATRVTCVWKWHRRSTYCTVRSAGLITSESHSHEGSSLE